MCSLVTCFLEHTSVFYSVLQLNDVPLCGFKILFLHSPVNGHLCCFYLFSIMDNTAVNIHAHLCCLVITAL